MALAYTYQQKKQALQIANQHVCQFGDETLRDIDSIALLTELCNLRGVVDKADDIAATYRLVFADLFNERRRVAGGRNPSAQDIVNTIRTAVRTMR